MLALLSLLACDSARRGVIELLDSPYSPQLASETLEPTWSARDLERERLDVNLIPIAEGLEQPTDFRFYDGVLLVTEKTGKLRWFDPADGTSGTLLDLDVLTVSEQGLLGLELHPDFADNGRLFVNYTPAVKGGDISRVESWVLSSPREIKVASAQQERVILEVDQPYQNHNAGALAFGPDGMLYVGWGDGGFRFDHLEQGQDRSSFLGSMLRIDVDGAAPYEVPPDNPFVGEEGVKPELWAWGLRNPWRYSFAPDGRLVVADVGQDRYEEVSIVGKGDNLGWKVREALHCFEPEEGCPEEGFVDPVYEYGRDDGQSITGGFVYTGERLPQLSGRYVFGDFISGRIWAIALPKQGAAGAALALGQWPVLISSFGRDGDGELYLADYGRGAIFRIDPGR
jgi:glucose/arabinose dehydrogenase